MPETAPFVTTELCRADSREARQHVHLVSSMGPLDGQIRQHMALSEPV